MFCCGFNLEFWRSFKLAAFSIRSVALVAFIHCIACIRGSFVRTDSLYTLFPPAFPIAPLSCCAHSGGIQRKQCLQSVRSLLHSLHWFISLLQWFERMFAMSAMNAWPFAGSACFVPQQRLQEINETIPPIACIAWLFVCPLPSAGGLQTLSAVFLSKAYDQCDQSMTLVFFTAEKMQCNCELLHFLVVVVVVL